MEKSSILVLIAGSTPIQKGLFMTLPVMRKSPLQRLLLQIIQG